MAATEDRGQVREIDYRRILPWTEIFRSFRIAFDPSKLLLAALGVVFTWLGWWGLAAAFDPGKNAEPKPRDGLVTGTDQYAYKSDVTQYHLLRNQADRLRRAPWDDPGATTFGQTDPDDPADPHAALRVPDRLRSNPLGTIVALGSHWKAVLRPVNVLIEPFVMVFDRRAGAQAVIFMALAGFWALLVWSLFAGAITRIAAVQVARDEKVGLVEAVRFALGKYLAYLAAPLFMTLLIAGLGIVVVGGVSLLVLIPGFGPVFAGLFWGLPLIAGLILAAILVGLAVGWPLMFATISAEGSDSFDAMSRSYAYAYQRPWHYLLYTIVALIYGSFAIFVVTFFTQLLIILARWAVCFGAHDYTIDHMFYAYAPAGDGWRTLFLDPTGDWRLVPETRGEQIGGVLMAIWLYPLFLLMFGFVYSYFWSAATVIYFLLRRNVDATDLDEVYLEEDEKDDLLGMAAPIPGAAAPEPAAGSPITPLPIVQPPPPPAS